MNVNVLPCAPGIPPAALHWWRLRERAAGRPILGQRAAAAYFAENPDELAPFQTADHREAVQEWLEENGRRWRESQHRVRMEALAERAIERAATEEHVPHLAPRRQPVGARTRSSRGQPADATSSRSDDDPPPRDGRRLAEEEIEARLARWRAGVPVKEIAAEFGVSHPAIIRLAQRHGDYVPGERRRGPKPAAWTS